MVLVLVYASVYVQYGVGRLEHEGVTTLAGESLGQRRLLVPTRCEDRCMHSTWNRRNELYADAAIAIRLSSINTPGNRKDSSHVLCLHSDEITSPPNATRVSCNAMHLPEERPKHSSINSHKCFVPHALTDCFTTVIALKVAHRRKV